MFPPAQEPPLRPEAREPNASEALAPVRKPSNRAVMAMDERQIPDAPCLAYVWHVYMAYFINLFTYETAQRHANMEHLEMKT